MNELFPPMTYFKLIISKPVSWFCILADHIKERILFSFLVPQASIIFRYDVALAFWDKHLFIYLFISYLDL